MEKLVFGRFPLHTHPPVASAPARSTMHGVELQDAPLSRIRHGYSSSSSSSSTTDFGFLALSPTAATTTYFLPLPLMPRGAGAHAFTRHRAQDEIPAATAASSPKLQGRVRAPGPALGLRESV
ncbi:uncharacterized protein V6R79_007433 [Siganus canaliculatus]